MRLKVPDIDKRPRDGGTDALIQELLEEEQQRKKSKKSDRDAGRKQIKGLTLAEMEAQEGGPVKDSLRGMAQVKRALQRKAATGPAVVDETALGEDVEAFEEEAPDQEVLKDLLRDMPPAAPADDSSTTRGGGAKRRGRPSGMEIDDAADPDAVAAAAEAGEAGGDETEAVRRDLDDPEAGPAAGTYGVTAFNLKDERQEGYFDEEGNFVFRKEEEEGDKDAWLSSAEAAPVSDKVRALAEARAAALAAAEVAPVLGEVALAEAQRELAGLLLPGESVAGALRRLGPAARKGKALPKRAQQQQQTDGATNGTTSTTTTQQPSASGATTSSSSAPPDPQQAAAALARITELADLLLQGGGELDVYSQRREQLERWAAAVLPAAPLTLDDPDDDMFASDDEAAGAKANKPAIAAPAAPAASTAPAAGGPPQQPQQQAAARAASQQQAGPGPSSTAAAAATPAAAAGGGGEDSYGSWPIKELRRFCQERGVDPYGIVEKQELVATVRRLAAKGPQTSAAAAAAGRGAAGAVAPAGFVWDAASGYYLNTSSGMYWDAASGGYYNGSEGKWYAWDAAAGQYVPWTTASS